MSPSYAVITPARDESENLRRQAAWLAAQTVPPEQWVIVDNGSGPESRAVARELEREHGWLTVIEVPAGGMTQSRPEEGDRGNRGGSPDGAVDASRRRLSDTPEGIRRGGKITRAFEAGLPALERRPDIVVKLDADVSGEPDYFARLVNAFATDPQLGMASGSCYELVGGEWRQRHVTGDHVWGASRAYRWHCLQAVLPLEDKMGWDAVDELKAAAAGWQTRTLVDLPFRHHRREGERDGSRRRAWEAGGHVAHYLGYKLWYLSLRALHHSRKEPAALAMLLGYASAALKREPRCADEIVRRQVRSLQSFRALPLRAREALGRR